jgi:2-methylcitrate dehydratase PrpD
MMFVREFVRVYLWVLIDPQMKQNSACKHAYSITFPVSVALLSKHTGRQIMAARFLYRWRLLWMRWRMALKHSLRRSKQIPNRQPPPPKQQNEQLQHKKQQPPGFKGNKRLPYDITEDDDSSTEQASDLTPPISTIPVETKCREKDYVIWFMRHARRPNSE